MRKPTSDALVFNMKGAPGKKVEGICPTRNTTKVQRVQRGTNCPLGNRRKTSTSKARVRKYRHALGTCQGEELAATELVAMIGPNVTSISATSNAMRSSDRRQTISVLTTKHSTTEASVSATVYAAYTPRDRPIPLRAPTCPGESCVYQHAVPAQGVCSCARYTGRLAKKIPRVRMTRVIQTPRESTIQRRGTRA